MSRSSGPVVARVHRVETVCAYAPSTERADDLRDAVRSAVAGLTAGLERLLEDAIVRDGVEVLAIRRLNVELEIGADWDAHAIAARWVEATRISIERALAQDDGATVIRYDEEAMYLADFLVRRASDGRVDAWPFRAFEGLGMLPRSAALRTVLLEDPDLGLRALASLERQERGRVLEGLGDREALRVLEGFARGGSMQPLGVTVAAAWRTATTSGLPRDDRGALDLYVESSTRSAELSGPGLMTAVIGIAALARVADQLALRAALQSRDVRAIERIAGAEDAALIRPLVEDPEVDLGGLLSEVEPPAPTDAAATRWTRHGGAFLLAPFAVELARRIAGAQEVPPLDAMAGTDAMAFVLTARALGTDRALAVVRDPVIRDLFGVPPSVGLSEMSTWSRELGRWLAALPDLDAAPPAAPAVLAVLVGARRTGKNQVLLVDAASDAWLGLGPASEASLWRAVDDPGTTVIADGVLGDVAREHLGRARVEPMRTESDAGDERDPQVDRVARLRTDVERLRVPRELAGAPAVERWLVRQIRSVLAAFAAELRGFEQSSGEYVRHNFLDLDAAVVPEADRWVVRLGTPPLNLVLSTSGLAAREYELPAAPGRRVVIHQ